MRYHAGPVVIKAPVERPFCIRATQQRLYPDASRRVRSEQLESEPKLQQHNVASVVSRRSILLRIGEVIARGQLDIPIEQPGDTDASIVQGLVSRGLQVVRILDGNIALK